MRVDEGAAESSEADFGRGLHGEAGGYATQKGAAKQWGTGSAQSLLRRRDNGASRRHKAAGNQAGSHPQAQSAVAPMSALLVFRDPGLEARFARWDARRTSKVRAAGQAGKGLVGCWG